MSFVKAAMLMMVMSRHCIHIEKNIIKSSGKNEKI